MLRFLIHYQEQALVLLLGYLLLLEKYVNGLIAQRKFKNMQGFITSSNEEKETPTEKQLGH
jgi:hypothetical protein